MRCSSIRRVRTLAALAIASFAATLAPIAHAQSISQTSFTYQGRLTDADQPASGPITLGFTLFANATGGSPLAPQITVPGVTPDADGQFTVPLDFASSYFRDGTPRHLEVAVIRSGQSPVVLSPRQAIRPAPLAAGIAGLEVLTGPAIDVDQTANIASYVNGFVPTSYQTFTCNRSGTLRSVTVRANVGLYDAIQAIVYRGSGISGSPIAYYTGIVSPQNTWVEHEIDLSPFNISVASGEVLTITLSSDGSFSTVTTAAPGAIGFNFNGQAINFWFRTRIDAPPRVADAERAFTSGVATIAHVASTADSLRANSTSALYDNELRLRSPTDANHALGWFGGSRFFRNTSLAPDGPVLFGNSGGALATHKASTLQTTVALQWNDSAQVGIGTAPSSAGYRLELPNTAAPAGQGRANAWVTYSSRAYKHNIETIRDPLSLIQQLRGVRFDWNAPDVSEAPAKHDIGFIAEEIAAVLPDLVSRDADGNATGLDYGRVVPVAIEAIKQQQAQIAQQQSEIQTLRDQLDRMEQRLNELDRSKR